MKLHASDTGWAVYVTVAGCLSAGLPRRRASDFLLGNLGVTTICSGKNLSPVLESTPMTDAHQKLNPNKTRLDFSEPPAPTPP